MTDAMRQALRLIEVECYRQVAIGMTPEHNAQYVIQELSRAAACYATPRGFRRFSDDGKPLGWPWPLSAWRPATYKDSQTRAGRLRELQKAGALIVAEIELMQAGK